MTQTIVGLFDSVSEAQSALDRLALEGIAHTDMHLHAQDESSGREMSDEPLRNGGTATRTLAADTAEGAPHEGGIVHFFKRLFGNDDAPAAVGHYRESVRRGHALLTVDVVDDSRIDTVRAVMNDAGAMDIEERVSQWKTAGYSGYDSSAQTFTADEVAADRKAFPVPPVSESVNLREEHATIERRAVDRPATEADLKERSLEIRETAEEAVVAKTGRVVEEVVVGKESSQRTETVHDTVRGTEVEVERDAGTPATGSTDPLKKKPL
jgi:hypothetical protein